MRRRGQWGIVGGREAADGSRLLVDTRPATCWQHAFLTGNGTLGALVPGDPWDERIVLTHHRLVLPTAGSPCPPPDLTARLEVVQDLLLAGRDVEALHLCTYGWPRLSPRPFHPALLLGVRHEPVPEPASGVRPAPTPGVRPEPGGDRSPAEAVTGYRRWTDQETATIGVAWNSAGVRWTRTCAASRPDGVVAVRCTRSRSARTRTWVRLDQVPDGAPSGLRVRALDPDDGRCHRPGRRSGDDASGAGGAGRPGRVAPLLLTRVDYPDPSAGTGDTLPADLTGGTRDPRTPPDAGPPAAGSSAVKDQGGYLVGARLVAPGALVRPQPGGACVIGGADLLVLVRIEPRAPGESLGPVRERLVRRLRAVDAEPGRFLRRAARAHRATFARVRTDLGGTPAVRALPVRELLARVGTDPNTAVPVLLERLVDAGRYHLLCASGALPPRLTGIWQGDWDAAWSAALTLDANLPLQLAGAVTTDVPEAVTALADLVHDQLADWRCNARRLFGARGVVAPAHTDGLSGLSYHFESDYPLHLWTAGADWLLTTLADHAQARNDEGFLRSHVRPLAEEIADFYLDLLTRRDADGHVVVVPSYSPENRPAGTGTTPAAVNATMDLAAARHALETAVALAGPGTDPERVRAWRDLATALPPYRVNADGALAEWAWPGLADRYDHRHISHLYPVWPLHAITPRDEPRLAGAARLALHRRGAQDGSAHGTVHHALVAARLGDTAHLERMLRHLLTGDFLFSSLMTSHYPGLRVFNADASCALPAVLLEALVDSVHPGPDGTPATVTLLPAVPPSLAAGRWRGASTRAGVRVAHLSWDLGAGRAEALLHAFGTVCHSDAFGVMCRSAAAGGRVLRVACPLPGARLDQDGRPAPLLADGIWEVRLEGARATRLHLGWTVAPAPRTQTPPAPQEAGRAPP